eukprot:CAMPEP_0196665188 /NCGR_PEP_ID=MMETSP1086-20130531/59933_1 /TAXON_ID=77921 /ORGANISM="Cyanoptyche  gloeocystis , Strain SAG4.97" /LENGTH=351 /DNA_ID=CAMNT_0042001815 /DNA_START=122 /DNA_END=1177 /DNA_ORIENTATION=+
MKTNLFPEMKTSLIPENTIDSAARAVVPQSVEATSVYREKFDQPRAKSSRTRFQDTVLGSFLCDWLLLVPALVLIIAISYQIYFKFSSDPSRQLYANTALQATTLTIVSGLSTGFGGLIVIVFRTEDKRKVAAAMAFSAGVMLYLSFSEMLPEAAEAVGLLIANLAMFAGMAFFAILFRFLPEPHPEVDSSASEVRIHLMAVGVRTAIAIGLHNLPEGIAVYMSCLKGHNAGLTLCIAMAMHNIPEGVAVAMPIYAATGSRWQALRYSLISGMIEPMCAVLIGMTLSSLLLQYSIVVHLMIASVSGMMAFLSFHDLIPTSLKYISPMLTSVSIALGMFLIFWSIYFINIAS